MECLRGPPSPRKTRPGGVRPDYRRSHWFMNLDASQVRATSPFVVVRVIGPRLIQRFSTQEVPATSRESYEAFPTSTIGQSTWYRCCEQCLRASDESIKNPVGCRTGENSRTKTGSLTQSCNLMRCWGDGCAQLTKPGASKFCLISSGIITDDFPELPNPGPLLAECEEGQTLF
jgi:hypothetical protein